MKWLPKILFATLLFLPATALAITNAPWSITNLSDTFIVPNLINGSAKGLLISASSTINGNLSVSSLTSGNCVQAGVGGLLTTIAGACGTPVGSITAVTATNPLFSSGGTSPNISTIFSTTTTFGIGNNGFLILGATGIPFVAASSTLNLPNGALANSSITVNGTTFNLGDSKTITAASSTLLSDFNTFLHTITGSVSGNAGTATALQTGRTISITGDLTYTSPTFDGSGNVTAAGTLATVNTNVGTFTYPSVTVNGKGLITAISNGTAPTTYTGTFPIAVTGSVISSLFSTTTNNGMPAGFLYSGSGGIWQTAASSSLFGYTPLNPTRNINTTAPLGGGGALTSDLTLTCTSCSTFAYPFTPSTFGINVSATSTPILDYPGFIAATSTTGVITASSSIIDQPLATAAGTFVAADPTGKLIATTSPSGSNSAFSPSANYATTGALPSNTYNNGASGVGATITEVGTGALSVDGNSPSVGQRVLIKNEATAANNGLYDVTVAGSGIAAFVLTRDTAYNSSSEIIPGIITYVISGATNDDDFWAMVSSAPITVGTTALNYTEVSGGGASVTTVSNSDSTLTISPTTGNVVASLNLGHANTWSVLQNFGNATSTLFSATYASTTQFIVSGQSGCAQFASGVLTGTGSNCAASSFSYPFPVLGLGTTSPIMLLASTTVGNGTVTGGLTVSGTATTTNLIDTNVTSALGLFDANHKLGAYGGAAGCTNQFVTALSAVGATTCTSLTSSNVTTALGFTPFGGTNPLPIANGGTNATSFSANNLIYANSAGTGLVDLGSATTTTSAAFGILALNAIGNAAFTYASSTQLTSGGTSLGAPTFYINSLGGITAKDVASGLSGILSPVQHLTLATATTTTWGGTTTPAYVPVAVAPFAGTLKDVRCLASSTAAFLGIQPLINGAVTAPSYFVASNTVGIITFTGSNTFTIGQSLSFFAGTTTLDTHANGVSCTFDVIQTT